MNRKNITELYSKKILSLSKNPYHFEKISNPQITIPAINPMCGDKFHLYLQSSKSDISSAHFHGFGCALSKASTSILIERIEGKTKMEIIDLSKLFLDGLKDGTITEGLDEDMKLLISLISFDGRLDCIKLSWESLYEDLISGKIQ